MQSVFRQKGASMPMVLVFIGMTAVIFTIAFKLYPVFYEHWQIQAVLESYEEDFAIKDMNAAEIESNFRKRLLTNNVRDFNVDEGFYAETTDEGVYVSVEYEVRVKMYKNIDAIVSFEEVFEKKF